MNSTLLRQLAYLAGATFLLMADSCAPSYKVMVEERSSMALALKASCADERIPLPEVTVADSMVALANELRAKGKHREAHSRLDYAVIFYQLALAKHSLQKSLDENRELETSLGVARSKLREYETMLDRVKASLKDE